MKRLREKIVADDESYMNKLNPRMIDHLRASKPPCSTKLSSERESKGGAEYVEDGSVAMRSGTIQHSRLHPIFGFGFGPKETDYTSDLRSSETFSLPKRSSKDINNLHKKAMRNSSELAEPSQLPTVCFGLVRKQETESYTTQVVDSQPEVEARGAHATREMKRKLNPFLEKCEAAATQKPAPKGVMPSELMHGLALPKPLSLERFVALIMSPPDLVRDPNFNKTDIHPTNMSTNSESIDSHLFMCNHPPSEVGKYTSGDPEQGIARPDKSGGDLF